MTRGQSLVRYYNGIAAFYNYLGYQMGEKNFNPELIKDQDNIKNAKVALLALFFAIEKEYIVEKNKVVKEQFDSKIIDDMLAESIEMIAENKGTYYQIGSYTETNPANIIALIRNKFSHGKYEIEVDDNNVIIRNKDNTLRIPIDIDKLFLLVCKSIQSLISFPKQDKITRIHAQNKYLDKLGFSVITTREQARKVLEFSRFKEYSLYSFDKRNIEPDALKMFSLMLDTVKKVGDDEKITVPLLDTFREDANNKKLEFMIKKKKVKNEEIEDILNLVDRTTGFYEIKDLYSQVHFLLSRAVERLAPDYQKGYILNGLIYNMSVLYNMDKENEYDFTKLCKKQASSIYNVSDECIVSALLAEFESLYISPLDDIYLGGSSYTLDREMQLDFSKLDLSFIKPKKITMYDKHLTQEKPNYEARIKDIDKAYKELKEAEENLRRAKAKGNTKGTSFLEKEIQNIRENLVDECAKAKEVIDNYDLMRDDYRINQKYFENRAIIEGIRNAISHGNIILKKFDSAGDMDDTIINLKDIHEGELKFELDITVRDFEKLFNKTNVDVILSLFSKLENYEYSSIEPKQFKIKSNEF